MTDQIKNLQSIQSHIIEKEMGTSAVGSRTGNVDNNIIIPPPPPPNIPQFTNIANERLVEEEDEDYDAELESYLQKRTRIVRPIRQKELLPSNLYVRDEVGLKKALEKLNSKKTNRPWIKTLSRTAKRSLVIVNRDDPFEKELKFIEQTTPTVLESLSELRKMGIPTDRPSDYFAEMVKSDEHMFRVKRRLKKTSQDLERRERKRVEKDYKKLSKAIQQKRAKEKARDKRDNLRAIQTWKKIAQKVKAGEYSKHEKDEDEDDDEEEGSSNTKNKRRRRRKKETVPDFDQFMQNFAKQKKQMYKISSREREGGTGKSKSREGDWLENAMENIKVGSKDYKSIGGYGIKKEEYVPKKRRRRGKRQSKRKRQRKKK